MKKTIFSLIVLSVITTITYAQNTQKAITALQNKTQAKVMLNNSYGIADFIQFPAQKALKIKGTTLSKKVITFLNTNKAIFKLKDAVNEFVFETPKTDVYGLKTVTIKQQHNGVEVFDGKLRFHFNSKEELTAVNGNYIPNIKINTTTTITKEQAEEIALQLVEKQKLTSSQEPLKVKKTNLYVFNKGLLQDFLGANYLAYQIEIANDQDVREFIFIDAHNGQKVTQYTGMAHAINRVVYEVNNGTVVWQEGDTFPGSLTIWQQNEVVTSEHVYNFFKNTFNYVSYDNADAQMKTINNNPNISCPNANWNGTTANYCDGTAADDVVAHEWSHAYTQHTSGLIYAYQSGALNESFSDIWGETIDLLNGYEDAGENNSPRASCGSSNRWMIGEDASSFGGAIRDMWNPNCKGDPGKLTDNQYRCGTGDSGGVHFNSGIPNHVYALIVDGGNYNGQTIFGLGFVKAANIFWRAQSQYLTATSNFNDFANALEAACTDLIGVNLNGLSTTTVAAGQSGEVITTTDLAQVTKAILAVELRVKLTACNYAPLLTPIADLCGAATNNPIFVETWETGIGNWTVSQIPVNAGTWEPRDWEIVTNLPDNKQGKAIFAADPIIGDCSSDLENGIMRLQSPVITLPNYTTGRFELAFTHYVATEPTWDGGNLKISINGGAWGLIPTNAFIENAYNGTLPASNNDNPLSGEAAFTGNDEGSNSGSWGTSVINLSLTRARPNDTIQLRWELASDGCNGSIGWYIDNIVVYNCDFQALATENFDINNVVTIYPNPSNGIFTISNTNNARLIKAEVYDVTGRFIKAIKLTNSQTTNIDLSSAASGMYFVHVVTENTKGIIKLIKK